MHPQFFLFPVNFVVSVFVSLNDEVLFETFLINEGFFPTGMDGT